MTRPRVLLIAALATLAAGPSRSAPTASPDRIVVAFFDLTSSTASDESVQSMTAIARDLVCALDGRAYLVAMPIDRGSAPPLLQLQPEPQARTPRDQRERRKRIRTSADALAAQIRTRRPAYMADSVRDSHISCILHSLEEVSNVIARERVPPNDKVPVDILYVSDMVEDCDDPHCSGPGCTPMSLTRKGYADALKRLDGHVADVTFGDPSIRLTVILTPEVAGGDPRNAAPEDRQQFWRKALPKYGFTPEQLQRWNFSTSVPTSYAAPPGTCRENTPPTQATATR